GVRVCVCISVQEASADNVAQYVARYQLGYTIAADVTGEIYRLYRPPGLPTSIFVTPDGIVRSFVLRPLREAEAATLVEQVLPSASSAAPPSASSPAPRATKKTPSVPQPPASR